MRCLFHSQSPQPSFPSPWSSVSIIQVGSHCCLVKDCESLSFLKLTRDPRICKTRTATDLRRNVWYVQTYNSSSNSTRWGKLTVTLIVCRLSYSESWPQNFIQCAMELVLKGSMEAVLHRSGSGSGSVENEPWILNFEPHVILLYPKCYRKQHHWQEFYRSTKVLMKSEIDYFPASLPGQTVSTSSLWSLAAP